MTELAALESGGQIFFAEHERRDHEPHTAITELIQGIWAHDPGFARKHLRARIHATSKQLNALERGMVKVAAKRITAGLTSEAIRKILDPTSNKEWIRLKAKDAPPLLDAAEPRGADPISIALDFESKTLHASEKLHEKDRRVAAVLVSPERKLLAAAINTNAKDRTRHAEVNLIQGWWARENRAIPQDCELYVTVQCCRMCAGMIWDSCENPWSLRVHYLRPDPGPMAQGTILQAGTPERRLVATCALELELQLETQFPAPSSS